MQEFVSALEPVARLTVATLFNSLWEAAVLAFAVWAILRALPNLNATTRYAAWCVALVGSLLLPLGSAIPQISVQRPAAAVAVHSTAHIPAATPAKHPSSTGIAPVAAPPVTTRTSAPAFKLPERVHFAFPDYLALVFFGLWVAASVLMLVRLGVNLWRLEHLKRDALPLPLDYRERLSQWALAEKGEREVRLCICDRIEVPVAVGLFDSMILIPQHLLETLTPDEIDQIMLHELGHLRRADDWTNGLQRVIQALFFFNPAILYISQQLDLEREVACDDWVLRQTKSVRPYATCLTKMAEVTAWPHRAIAAPGVFVTRRGISVRIERLLRAGRNVRTSISFGPAGAVVAALVVMFFVLQSIAPSFAFTLPASPQSAEMTAKVTHEPHHAAVAAPHRNVTVVALATQSPSPEARKMDVTVPAIHVHTPGHTIHIPPTNIDIPKRHYSFTLPAMLPAPRMSPLPRNFNANITRQVNEAMRAGMRAGAAASAGAAAAAAVAGTFNCTGCDYSGQNLAGRSFRGQQLNGSDFSRANLQNADFSNAKIVGVDFSRANLRGANFSHAQLSGCDLSHADLTGVNFEGVQMVGCDVDARSLTPTQARALIFACRNGCDFNHANLSGQDLRGVSLTGVDLNHADLRGADLSQSKLNGVDLSGARLDGARFNGASITGCDLSNVDLKNVDLSNAKMAGDRLDGNSPMR